MSAKRHLRPIKDTARFYDLEVWDDLFAYCYKCGKQSQLNRDALERRYGAHTRIQSLTTKLCCKSVGCNNRENNMIGAKNKLRD